MVDEAHSLGVLGQHGFGIAEHFGIDPREVDIWMGTLSKTLAGCGGYIAGSSTLIDYLRCMTGAFVYSVGLPPVIAASVEKALHIMHREPDRVATLHRNAVHFLTFARQRALDTGNGRGTAVCPIVVGDSIPAVILSQQLLGRGINVQPVLYPAVAAVLVVGSSASRDSGPRRRRRGAGRRNARNPSDRHGLGEPNAVAVRPRR
jgi:8-amino-7-oxononanoate synthase